MRSARIALPLAVLSLITGACRQAEETAPRAGLTIRAKPLAGPEATSLLGEPLERAEPANHAELLADLEEALRAFFEAPTDEDAITWLGRRYAYLMRYREAVDVYSHGLRLHPESSKLRRHRGHRWITLRRFDDAIRDLEAAAALIEGQPDEVEPDGAPNELGIPRSTHQSNIWYHLGLAHYLRGDFAAAVDAYERCLEVARVNDDMLCATVAWYWAALRRAGRNEDARAALAPIHADMDVIENHAYHALLLFYRGDLTWEDVAPTAGDTDVLSATKLYGLANWLYVEGRTAEARGLFERIVGETPWPAFGHVAAEANLARLRGNIGIGAGEEFPHRSPSHTTGHTGPYHGGSKS